MEIQTGALAPTFVLPNAAGELISLEAFRGQWVVLYFYPRDLTPGCTKEACGFRDHHAALAAQNIQILGVSGDDAKSHQKFIAKHQLPFTLLSDLDHIVAKAYGSYGPKKFMGKDYEGLYRHTFVIDPTGMVAKIYRKVKPEPHAQELLTDIVKLMAQDQP
jgi:thioredoxin-dependent peroxiredoxin